MLNTHIQAYLMTNVCRSNYNSIRGEFNPPSARKCAGEELMISSGIAQNMVCKLSQTR